MPLPISYRRYATIFRHAAYAAIDAACRLPRAVLLAVFITLPPYATLQIDELLTRRAAR